jgi:hypothetical protein
MPSRPVLNVNRMETARARWSEFVISPSLFEPTIELYGGWIAAGAVAASRHTELARKMLAGEIEAHLEGYEFAGRTVADQLLWGGATGPSAEIVRMVIEHVDWPPKDPRWFWILCRPLHAYEDQCFPLILSRSGPHHRADYGQTILHEIVSSDCRAGVQLATILLEAGARLDVRDKLFHCTPLGWACRWGGANW